MSASPYDIVAYRPATISALMSASMRRTSAVPTLALPTCRECVADARTRRLSAGAHLGHLRMLDEALLGRRDADAGRDLDAAFAQRHLDTAERREDLEFVQRAEMTDPEHATAELAQPHAEREVEAIARSGDHDIRVEAVRHHDRGEAVGVRVGLLAEDAEAPGADRRANAVGQPVVPREHVVEALLEQHVERLAEPEQPEGRRRVREESGRVVLEDRTPVEEAPPAAALA